LAKASARSQNFSRNKSKVKFDFKTVCKRVLPILKCIEVGEYPSKIGRRFGWSKQHVFYYVKKLEKAGFIRRDKRSNAVFYLLTPKGQNFLTGSEGLLFGSGIFRLHAAKYRFGVVCDGVWPVDWRRVCKMNWTALLGLEGGVTVEKTPSSVIVHVETLYGRSPVELLDQARQLADRTARALMLKYGCKLAEGKLCRKPHIGIDDPVSEFLSRYFEVSAGDRKMDRSEGIGEIDNFSLESAVDYLLMPEKVKAIDGKLDALVDQLTEVCDFLSALKKAVNGSGVDGCSNHIHAKDVGYRV